MSRSWMASMRLGERCSSTEAGAEAEAEAEARKFEGWGGSRKVQGERPEKKGTDEEDGAASPFPSPPMCNGDVSTEPFRLHPPPPPQEREKRGGVRATDGGGGQPAEAMTAEDDGVCGPRYRGG